MIGLFDILQALDDRESNISLDNFQINQKSISLRWTVSNISVIYQSEGLLDKFLSLSFIQDIRIPYYREGNDGFSFILDANLKEDVR